LRAGQPPLRLTHALTASSLEPRYLEFWPLAKRAWRDVAGLEPLLVVVGEAQAVPQSLRDDPAVDVFEPLPGVEPALQAQCIRLLYPALVETDGAVIVSDIDLVPLSRTYYADALRGIDRDHFVSYRDVLLHLGEIPICYNAARPSTWAALFGVTSGDELRTRLREWTSGVAYEGMRGGAGWTTDQHVLHRVLLERGRSARDVWILDDYYTGFRRLERAAVAKAGDLNGSMRELIATGRYSDYHCLEPHAEFRELNELAVDLAAEAARRIPRTSRSLAGS
jgi:hypothetical protein